MAGDIPPGISVVPIPHVGVAYVVKIIAIPEEDVGDLIRIDILDDAEDIVVPFAVANPAESLPPLDVGVVYANPKPVREPAHRHELRGDVFHDATGERLYAEVNGVAQ
jgi:hypothetical protein